MSVSDYQPISLINSSLKLITKIMAQRLNKVLPKIVSLVQSGFMKGCQAADNILVTSEVVAGLKTGRSRGLVYKVDFEKAFDTIDWDFPLHLLSVLNFGSK